MGLSAVVITYNEGRNIKRCLDSVKWTDEIIVVDSFSTDKTKVIARNYKTKIFNLKFLGYSKTKNFGIRKAKNEWILSIDADEVVSDSLKKEILHKIRRTNLNGFYVPRKVFFLNKWINHCGWYPDYQLRLFRKKSGRFDEEKLVHENVNVAGKVGYLKNDLLHFSYRDLNQYFAQFNKYTTLAALNMAKDNKSFSLFKLFFNPTFTFFKMYVMKSGFLDGFAGFTICFMSSFYNFVKYIKLWELTKKR